MANFLNQSATGIGGFRHYSGLLPATYMSGDPFRASVRPFHVPAANASAIFRGDILVFADATNNAANVGGGDLPANISAPSTSVVIGNGGGSGLGNASMAPNAARWAPGNGAAAVGAVIAGVCVGFGPLTLYMAKNGFQYIPASTEAWVWVETDPEVEMYATVPTVPGTAFNLNLNMGADVKANAGFQSTRFGVSGLSLDAATFAAGTTAAISALPLRILSSGNQIGNDPTAVGFVAKVMFNKLRHFRGSPGIATANNPFPFGD